MALRTTCRQHWPLLIPFLFLLILIPAVVGGIAAIQSHHSQSQTHYQRKYLAGQCVLFPAKESWEQPILLRIEMAGDDNYLVRITPASLYRDQAGLTLSFPFVDSLNPITCPTKG